MLALGLAVALAVRPPLSMAVAATALFALFHGVAHGLELPEMSSPWAYAAGFVAATAALHAAGYARGACVAASGGAVGAVGGRGFGGDRGVVAGGLSLYRWTGLIAGKLAPTGIRCPQIHCAEQTLWELACPRWRPDRHRIAQAGLSATMSRNRPCRDDASQCPMFPAPPPRLN